MTTFVAPPCIYEVQSFEKPKTPCVITTSIVNAEMQHSQSKNWLGVVVGV